MRDREKNREQLEAEIKDLRERLESEPQSESHQQDLAGSLTRRRAIMAWIAPVLISVPLANLEAQSRRAKTRVSRPLNRVPKSSPTPVAPTSAPPPSRSPTSLSPTPAPEPTRRPTPVAPTVAPPPTLG